MVSHYILNQDISMCIFQRIVPSRRCAPCLDTIFSVELFVSGKAVRIDMSSANVSAKSHLQMSPSKMSPFLTSQGGKNRFHRNDPVNEWVGPPKPLVLKCLFECRPPKA